VEGSFEPFFDEALLGPIHRRRTHADRLRDRLVLGAGGRGQQNLSPLDHANRGLAAANEFLQLLPFFCR
jgi:hypothetical protein